MPNEQEVIIDPNNESVEEVAVVQEEQQSEESIQEEVKQDKPVETPEDKASRLFRQTNQARKKLGLPPLVEQSEKPKSKSNDLGYGEKAFLIASGIKNSEIEFTKTELKNSGMSLDSLLENGYFQSRLKEFREQSASENATPKTSKRTGQSSQTSVEYWLAKGELPEDITLRRKVVNARIDAEKNKNVFN